MLRGFPSPWSQAARACFEIKNIDFAKVHVAAEDPPGALLEWTGQRSFPVAIFDSERPRSGWAEILLLAERLAPEPRLIPIDGFDRSLLFGLGHEMLGEMGLAWCRRLVGLQPLLGSRADDPELVDYLYKYGSAAEGFALASTRITTVLHLLAERLRRQRARGSEFLIGETLSAVDLYWAVVSNLLSPLPDEILPLARNIRATLTEEAEPLIDRLDPILIEHRDGIFRRYLRTPVEL